MSLRIPHVAAALVAALVASAPAGAASLPQRTFRVALGINGTGTDGASKRPAVSGRGTFVAFDSVASNLTLDPNGDVRDVFVRDLPGNRVRLVSLGLGGRGADGPSSEAAISADGRTVVFQSSATNLVAGDANGVPDVFLRVGDGPIARVSVAPGGVEANGASRQADVSADGRVIAFTSDATNLVAGDANGASDVFVLDGRDLTLTRISQPRGGGDASGASSAPSISPDGRYVSFYSTAPDLVGGDTNGKGDVFLADRRTGRMRRVSVSSRERQQNKAVVAPFEQVSDVSRGGRHVAFDSDATNLVKGDRNRDTDVFVRDVRRGRTERVSLPMFGRESRNDSYYPSITPDGRFVAFLSFGDNLFPGDARGEDVFVRDRRLKATSLMSVREDGRKRGREQVRQLLQRPTLSDDARVVGLTSTARLVRAEHDRHEDAYVRITDPPRARVSLRGTRYRFRADDRAADVFWCSIAGLRGNCPRSGDLAFLPRGRTYRLRVRALGPGMLASGEVVRRFRR